LPDLNDAKPGLQGPGFSLSRFPETGDLVAPLAQGMLRNFSTAPA